MKITTKTEQIRRIKKTRSWLGICVDRQKNGEPTDDKIVTVFVEKKIPKEQVSRRQRVPQKIDGMKTDVVSFDGLIVAEEDIDLDSRLRPLRLGCSIMNEAGRGKGSLGPLFRDEPFTGDFYYGSNSHVLLESPEKDLKDQKSLMIVQPGHPSAGEVLNVISATKIIPRGTAPRDSGIGLLLEAKNADPSVVGYGIPVRVRIPDVGETGRLVSWKMRSTGKKLFKNATVQVGYPAGPTIRPGVSIYERMSVGGTSGTAIVSAGGELELWELNFAGSPSKTIADPFDRAFDIYGKVPVLKDWWDNHKGGGSEPEPDGIIEIIMKLLEAAWSYIKNIFKR